MTQASPSSKRSMRGTTSLYFLGTREVHRSPGSLRWPSAEMSLYCRFSAVAIPERYRRALPRWPCAMLGNHGGPVGPPQNDNQTAAIWNWGDAMVSLELFGPDMLEDPYPGYRRLLEADEPQAFEGLPLWLLARYDHVLRALRWPDAFSSAAFGGMGP